MSRLRVGLLVNPVAGIGGEVALKGSDGIDVQAEARARGGRPRAGARTLRALGALVHRDAFEWLTWAGPMGAEWLEAAGLSCQVLGSSAASTDALDTQRAAAAMVAAGVELIVFAGGDGTARDLLASIPGHTPVLGIPAGVKMHSGVFATTPEQAGALLDAMASGGLVAVATGEVRDLDEAALRSGAVRPRYYGELKVPAAGGFLQHTKERGVENEALAINEITAEMLESLADETRPVVLGPGRTLYEIKQALGFQGTLLGFDVWQGGRVLARDTDSRWLLEHVREGLIVLSFTRGQGFLIGRGNQQLTPAFLRRIGREALTVVGTRTKILSLEGRPLLLDTDDPELDRAWSGLIEVIAGYQDRLYYRVSDAY